MPLGNTIDLHVKKVSKNLVDLLTFLFSFYLFYIAKNEAKSVMIEFQPIGDITSTSFVKVRVYNNTI